MSASGAPAAEWGEFGNTILHFPGAAPSLSVDLRDPIDGVAWACLARFGLGRPFGIVTAQNPHGRRSSAETNATLAMTLQQELASGGVQYVPLDACSPDGTHCEQSAAVLLPREEVVSIARRYAQRAVFWFDGERFWILPVLSSRPAAVLPLDRPAR